MFSVIKTGTNFFPLWIARVCPTNSGEIVDLLHRLNRDGLTVLMVTHDESSAAAVSHRIVHFLDGRIVDEKTFGGDS